MAIAEYERTIQVAFREVSDALASKKWLSEQVAIQRQSLEAQSVRARLAQLRYDNGAATYLEVLDAQRELLEAQQQLVQMRRNLLSSHIALYTALGGGAIDDPINGQNDRVTTSTP
jgi:outer membrane protein TolC